MVAVPPLDAVEVAAPEAVEGLLAAARAELAALHLKVRVAVARAVEAEAMAPSLDDQAAAAFLTACLSDRADVEGVQQRSALAAARAEAEERVRAARAEAARILGFAGNGVGDSEEPSGPMLPPTERAGGTTPIPPPSLGPPTVAPSPDPGVVTPGLPTPTAVRSSPRRTGLRRYLYVDIVLPVVAVLIVLIVLVAWIG